MTLNFENVVTYDINGFYSYLALEIFSVGSQTRKPRQKLFREELDFQFKNKTGFEIYAKIQLISAVLYYSMQYSRVLYCTSHGRSTYCQIYIHNDYLTRALRFFISMPRAQHHRFWNEASFFSRKSTVQRRTTIVSCFFEKTPARLRCSLCFKHWFWQKCQFWSKVDDHCVECPHRYQITKRDHVLVKRGQ